MCRRRKGQNGELYKKEVGGQRQRKDKTSNYYVLLGIFGEFNNVQLISVEVTETL